MAKQTVRRRSVALLTRPSAFSFYALFLVWAILTLFYYFGELVDFAHWEALRWDFFYTVHDVHRLLFLAPIVYAAYVFGIRATIIISIVSLMAFLPRALLTSPYPDPLLRAVVFGLIGGAIGCLTALARTESRRRARIEVLLQSERNRLQGIFERVQDGVLVVGPDYRIRYMNPSMIRDFGDGVGSSCHECLRGLDHPCLESCRLSAVLRGNTEKLEYEFPDGRTYEVVASPYVDADGAVCQLAMFRRKTRQRD